MNSATPDLKVLAYRIDAQDRITGVSGPWDCEAGDDRGEAACSAKVIGRSLWDFLCDPSSINLYRQLVKRAREGSAVRFHYRCDTPDRRRLYRMTIVPLPDGAVEFTSALRREEARPKVDLLDLAAQNRGDQFVRICSWCEKGALPDGSWAPIEQVVEVMGLFRNLTMPKLTHGICPKCTERMMRHILRQGHSRALG